MSPLRLFRQWRLRHLRWGKRMAFRRLFGAMNDPVRFNQIMDRLDWYDTRIAHLESLLK